MVSIQNGAWPVKPDTAFSRDLLKNLWKLKVECQQPSAKIYDEATLTVTKNCLNKDGHTLGCMKQRWPERWQKGALRLPFSHASEVRMCVSTHSLDVRGVDGFSHIFPILHHLFITPWSQRFTKNNWVGSGMKDCGSAFYLKKPDVKHWRAMHRAKKRKRSLCCKSLHFTYYNIAEDQRTRQRFHGLMILKVWSWSRFVGNAKSEIWGWGSSFLIMLKFENHCSKWCYFGEQRWSSRGEIAVFGN